MIKTVAIIFVIYLVIFLAAGCGALQRSYTQWTNEVTYKCVRGIVFVQSDSGLAWLPDRSGMPITCER